ncbi:MAG: DtxR family transcriptional regulator [Deltaproteobacteria bacterium]|nr:DtxR family transcriptional regulator [Deltaproteobacteria bacterium]
MVEQKISSSILSSSLEDYLETIFELVRDNKLARVKDIAKARNVRSASVISAMKKLAQLELITYEKREYIDLTPKGMTEARRIYAKHKLLVKFLKEVLDVPEEDALLDACSFEHTLSDASMDKMVRFLEFVQSCPEGKNIINLYKSCSLINDEVHKCTGGCSLKDSDKECRRAKMLPLSHLKAGEKCRAVHIKGLGPVRQRILDMGIIPGVNILVERKSLSGDPIWIKFQGFQLSLRKKEAETILVENI